MCMCMAYVSAYVYECVLMGGYKAETNLYTINREFDALDRLDQTRLSPR